MKKHKRGAGDGTDSPAVDGDAFECFPGAFEQRVRAFGSGLQAVDQLFAGAGVDVEIVAAFGRERS